MGPPLSEQYYALTLGRLRRAYGNAQAHRFVVANGKSVKIKSANGQSKGSLYYVCVQVQAGAAAPTACRFAGSEVGTVNAMHDFTTMGALFEQVVYDGEELYFTAERDTTLLVQDISVQGSVTR